MEHRETPKQKQRQRAQCELTCQSIHTAPLHGQSRQGAMLGSHGALQPVLGLQGGPLAHWAHCFAPQAALTHLYKLKLA
eukprot:1159941-Pelagomonas_calceolata.AAC.1